MRRYQRKLSLEDRLLMFKLALAHTEAAAEVQLMRAKLLRVAIEVTELRMQGDREKSRETRLFYAPFYALMRRRHEQNEAIGWTMIARKFDRPKSALFAHLENMFIFGGRKYPDQLEEPYVQREK